MCTDPKSSKKTDGLTIFVLLGSLCVKAASKMLVKLTPQSVNFINIFGAAFECKDPKNEKRHF